MMLERSNVKLFYRLHRRLMCFVNQRLAIIPNKIASAEDFAGLAPEIQVKVRDAFLANLGLLETFVTENSEQLSPDELDIVRSWRHLVTGRFYVFRELKKYTVFLSSASPVMAYGVVALSHPLAEVIGPHLPILVDAVLLPFKDKIVYDSLMTRFPISFGPGIRRRLNESFREAKLRQGIVASLPMSNAPRPPKIPKAKPRPKADLKAETAEVLQLVIGLIEEFCHEHLNDEYAGVCRQMAEKLARKRPSPLLRGSPNSWASGIVPRRGLGELPLR